MRSSAAKAARFESPAQESDALSGARLAHYQRRLKTAREATAKLVKCSGPFIGVWDTVDAVGLPLRTADIINTLLVAIQAPGHDAGQDLLLVLG